MNLAKQEGYVFLLILTCENKPNSTKIDILDIGFPNPLSNLETVVRKYFLLLPSFIIHYIIAINNKEALKNVRDKLKSHKEINGWYDFPKEQIEAILKEEKLNVVKGHEIRGKKGRCNIKDFSGYIVYS